MVVKNFYIIFSTCFLALSLIMTGACSAPRLSVQSNDENFNVSSISKVDKPNQDLTGNVYESKTNDSNEKLLKNLNCNNSNGYVLVETENYKDDEGFTSRDLDILVEHTVAVKIKLPIIEVKNFSLNSTRKTKNGFQIKTEWGGGLYHYDIQFDFRCKENNFYLYKVKKDSFSTTNPDSLNYLDKKETEVIKIEPNVPIQEFVIADYL